MSHRSVLVKAAMLASVFLIAHALWAAPLLAQVPLAPVRADHIPPAVRDLLDKDDARAGRVTQYLATQDVIRTDITVSIDPDRRTISGECTHVVLAEGAITLLLDERLAIGSVRTRQGVRLPHSRRGGVVDIRPTVAAGSGTPTEIEFTVRYQGPLTPSRDVWLENDLAYLGVEGRWYPSPPEFDLAVHRIVVRYPPGYSSACTGMLVGMAPSVGAAPGRLSDGDVWEAASPIPGAAVVVARLESSLGVLGDVFLGLHALASDGPDTTGLGPIGIPPTSEIKELVRFLEARYGPYPYEWLNVVSIPGAPDGLLPVSGPGLIVTGEASWVDPETAEIRMDHLASALSDSWWRFSLFAGTLVSDGLGTYAEESWLESTGDEETADQLREDRRLDYVAALVDSGGRAPLSICLGPGRRDDRVCRSKGAGLFRMLELLLGEDAFRGALRQVATTGRGQTVPLRTLIQAFERSAGDLDWFFYEWVVRGDLPTYVLRYKVEPLPRDGYMVRGSVRQEGEIYRTPVPLTVDLGVWSYEEWVAVQSSDQPFQFHVEMEPLQILVDGSHRIPQIGRRDRAALHYEQGVAAASRNEWGDAAEEFGVAAELEAGNAAYCASYGQALVRAGRVTEGIEVLEAAVKLDPRNANLRWTLAELYTGLRDHARALAHLDGYVRIDPRSAEGFAARAGAFLALGRTAEAERSLETAKSLIARGGTSVAAQERVFLAEGAVAEARGDTAAAIRAYRSALEADPSCHQARERLRALAPDRAGANG